MGENCVKINIHEESLSGIREKGTHKVCGTKT